MDISQRLDQLIDFYAGGNKSKFAESIGTSSAVIANYLGDRKSKPSFEVMQSIAETYPDVNLRWLVNGEGNMLLSGDVEQKPAVPSVAVRLLRIIDHFCEGNEKVFAESIGVKPAVINNYTKGKQHSKPGFEVLNKICETYPSINIEWLISGKGSMLKRKQYDLDGGEEPKFVMEGDTRFAERDVEKVKLRAENEGLKKQVALLERIVQMLERDIEQLKKDKEGKQE